MHEHADRLDFAPPPQPAAVRAFVLAIIAHVLLLLALTWGVNWKRESENLATEAELWSSVPQEAAPRVVQAPPLPKPAPPPPPAPKVVAPPPPPVPAPAPVKQPDIALEREKKKQELAERKKEELEQKKLEEAREKKLAEKKKQEELKRQEVAEQKAAEEKKKKEELAKAKAKQEEAKLAAMREAIRKENLDRMIKGATGAPTSTGTAARSSSPSASYAGLVQARVRPHIVFTDDISGNPKAEVEVRMAPDGTITSRRLVKSSGIKSWDDAVLRALDRTEALPRDVDGRVHTPLTIDFRPKG